MNDRALLRVGDIKRSIAEIRALLSGKSFAQVERDVVTRAALERFLEIVSEASRHLPDAWTAEHREIPWRRIADLGNVIRHAYDSVDLPTIWSIYERDLTPLEEAVGAMLAAHAPKDGSP